MQPTGSPQATTGTRPLRTRIHGIDFSGASDAGRRIWITSGEVVNGACRAREIRRAAALPGSARTRDDGLAALRRFLAAAGEAAIGLDFPFGLPRSLVPDASWADFVAAFPRRHASADAFRRWARAASPREERRATDRDAGTPFAPTNLRLYRQTFYGIREVLAPLIADGRAVALPMQPARPDVPWLLEMCPASTLKDCGLYLRYKGWGDETRRARAAILDALERRGLLVMGDDAVR